MMASVIWDFEKLSEAARTPRARKLSADTQTRRIVSDAGALNEKGAFERHALSISAPFARVTRRRLWGLHLVWRWLAHRPGVRGNARDRQQSWDVFRTARLRLSRN